MYQDTLIRIKNALARGRNKVKVPYSTFDMNILEALVKAGYIESAQRKGRGVKRIIDIKLKYETDGSPAISGVKFVSVPSRRIYSGYKSMKDSRQRFGHYLVSTPTGVMDGYEAKQKKVGGQVLFEIW
ncbi:MAG: 30S ribosomal protein S8 [Patescibacteria group bacterium]|nr:30S ribosomal protein S8 [Patescibacteria group bacterium]